MERNELAEIFIEKDRFVGQIAAERSVMIPAWIFSHPHLSDRSIRLWGYLKGALAGVLTIPGHSHAELASVLGISSRTVRECIQQLKSAGALTVVERFQDGRQVSNDYYLWPAVSPTSDGGGVEIPRHPDGKIPPSVYTYKDNIDKGVSPTKATRGTKKPSRYPEDFERAWSVYPRQTNKGKAYEAYKKTIDSGDATPEMLFDASRKYGEERRGTDKPHYTMHGSTFFGPQKRWLTYVSVEADSTIAILDAEQAIAAEIFDSYDSVGFWKDPMTEDAMFTNPVSAGYSRPTDKRGRLIDSSGVPYALDAQGKRRSIDYWN